MRVLPYGDRAVLAELDDPRLVPALRTAVLGLAGVVEAIAGAQTVLAVFDAGRTSSTQVRTALEGVELSEVSAASARSVELPVVYDGADVDEVAAETGLGPDEVVARHCNGAYVVRFCGFSPGFAYLDGLDPLLHVARRAEPRTAVPSGAVAIGGEFTGVYPRSSPGGWRLLGRTDAELWDVTSEQPALLAPGTRVRFVRS